MKMFLSRSAAKSFSGLWVVILLTALAVAQKTPSATKPEASPSPKAAVTLGGKPLFFVQERVLSFSPEDRAAAITDRINRISENPLVKTSAISVSEGDGSTDIVAGDVAIMSVTDIDAKTAGKTRQELATEYALKIRTAIQEQRAEHSWRTIAEGTGFTLLATIVLFGCIFLLNRFYPKLYARIRSWQHTRIRSIRIQTFELLPAERITSFLISTAKLMRFFVVAVLTYFYLSVTFNFFPWTRGYAAILLDYVLTPAKLIGNEVADYLPNLFFVAVILAVAYYISRLIKTIFTEVGKGSIAISGFYPEWAEPTFKIVRFLIIALTVVVVFPYLPGSKSPAFQGVSIFLGLLLSLGSSSAVANIVAGVILTYMRAFTIGDRVQIADTTGDVVEKNLLVTRVRTIKNVEITIANAMVLSSHIINFSTSSNGKGLILHTGVTIGYDAPWRQVHTLLIDAANSTENILKEPAPFVLQTALDDFYVSYELNAYTDKPNVMAKTYSDLHQHIQDKFNETGVEIMSPHYSALRDGNQTAIPDEYFKKGYSAKPFSVRIDKSTD
ncbi:MAG: mechanosensitive ion channel protein [Acidobacteria bacterium]|nr:MAG: mechanosensitive ion channel protein [Acidobacteriota bacterium]